jgi:signal transduction histidine kinase
VIETSVYRIVQELLSNAGRHSGASHLTIQLLVRAHVIALTVADDGKGLNYKESIVRNAVNFHSGLRNMRERTESLGGTFRVESTPGHGAEFMIEVPRALARVEPTPHEQALQ